MEKDNLTEAVKFSILVVERLEAATWKGQMKEWTPTVTQIQYEKLWRRGKSYGTT